MTQNKFWLVWNLAGNAPRKKHETEELACNEARRLASMYPQHEYVVFRAERSFKADVKVIETDLTVSEVEQDTPTETLTPKFKVGDKVKIKTKIKEYLKYYSLIWTIDSFQSDGVVVLNSSDKVYTQTVCVSDIELAE